jgi:REP element-mobilizing transposase RayT
MHPNALGQIVEATWLELPAHFPATRLDAFVVMPNHVHGILLLNQAEASTDRLSILIRDFKSFSTRRINEFRGAKGEPIWQRGYYEHVVRDERALDRIRRYVLANPTQWHLDPDNPAAPP